MLRPNTRVFNSTKVINPIAIKQRRKISGIDINTKEKIIKNLQNKLQPVGANNRNSISFGSNTTNMGSPSGNITFIKSLGIYVINCVNNFIPVCRIAFALIKSHKRDFIYKSHHAH